MRLSLPMVFVLWSIPNMKHIISLCLIFTVFLGSVIPAFAQKGRRPLAPNIKTSNIKTTGSSNRFGEVRAYSDGSGVLVKWEMAA